MVAGGGKSPTRSRSQYNRQMCTGRQWSCRQLRHRGGIWTVFESFEGSVDKPHGLPDQNTASRRHMGEHRRLCLMAPKRAVVSGRHRWGFEPVAQDSTDCFPVRPGKIIGAVLTANAPFWQEVQMKRPQPPGRHWGQYWRLVHANAGYRGGPL